MELSLPRSLASLSSLFLVNSSIIVGIVLPFSLLKRKNKELDIQVGADMERDSIKLMGKSCQLHYEKLIAISLGDVVRLDPIGEATPPR